MASKTNKKAKLSDSGSSSSSSSDSNSSPPPPTRKDSKTKTKSNPEAESVESSKGNTKSLRVAGEKEPTWELGSKKTLGDFKGRTYINIREYYTDNNGDVKPGKKGIGLTVEQWQNLCSTIDEDNQVLKK